MQPLTRGSRFQGNSPEDVQNGTNQCWFPFQTGVQQAKLCPGWALGLISEGKERTWGFQNSPALGLDVTQIAWKSPRRALPASCVLLSTCAHMLGSPRALDFWVEWGRGPRNPSLSLPFFPPLWSPAPLPLAFSPCGSCRSSPPSSSNLSPLLLRAGTHPAPTLLLGRKQTQVFPGFVRAALLYSACQWLSLVFRPESLWSFLERTQMLCFDHENHCLTSLVSWNLGSCLTFRLHWIPSQLFTQGVESSPCSPVWLTLRKGPSPSYTLDRDRDVSGLRMCMWIWRNFN